MIGVFLSYSIVPFISLLEVEGSGKVVSKFTLRFAVLQKNPVVEEPDVPQSQYFEAATATSQHHSQLTTLLTSLTS